VANRILLVGGRIAKSLSQLIAEEQRIIPEAAGALRRLQNAPGAIAIAHERDSAGRAEKYQDAAIARHPLGVGKTSQASEQLGVIGRVDFQRRAGSSSPSFRADAWGPS